MTVALMVLCILAGLALAVFLFVGTLELVDRWDRHTPHRDGTGYLQGQAAGVGLLPNEGDNL